MLTFFRRIRKGLLGEGATSKYLLYAIGEIALVVIGILIALQINNWNELKNQVEIEEHYMKSLLSDLSKDKVNLESNVEFGPIPVIYNDSLFAELQKRPLQGREKRIHHFLLLFTNGIEISYHDRTISQLRNSGGFGMIRNQNISDAILDYDVFMKESMRFSESSRSNHFINNDILNNQKMYELYRVEHLKNSAIKHRNDMERVAYPDDLRLLTYDDKAIKIALNSISSVRNVDEYNYQRAVEALNMNIKLDSLIRDDYFLEEK